MTLSLAWTTYPRRPARTCPAQNFFSGDIDEVALIGTQLTATQIAELYGAATTDFDVVEGGTLVVSAANGVLANDSDPQGDTLTASLVSGPAFASSFTLNSDGSFSYDHDGSEAITDSFVYEVNDGNGHIDHANRDDHHQSGQRRPRVHVFQQLLHR